jgi:hypothetical protein
LGGDLAQLKPVRWRTPDGIGVEIRRSTIPPGFAARLEGDFDRLYQDAAERTGDCGGVLLYFRRQKIAGRPALRRIERIPDGRYAAVLIVVVTNSFGVVITIECCDSADTHIRGDHAKSALPRTCQLATGIANAKFSGLESHANWKAPIHSAAVPDKETSTSTLG